MPDYRPDVEVEITLLPTRHGGRKEPLHTGCRPQFYYGTHDWDAHHTFVDVPTAAPGATFRSLLTFLSPAEHSGKLSAGTPFLLREGQRIIGYGSVIRLIELEKSAARARENDTAR